MAGDLADDAPLRRQGKREGRKGEKKDEDHTQEKADEKAEEVGLGPIGQMSAGIAHRTLAFLSVRVVKAS